MNSSNLQIPPQFSGVFGIGAPQVVFQPKAAGKWISFVSGLLLLGGSVLGFLVGAYITYSNYTKFGPASLQQQLQNILLPTVIGAGIFFLSGLVTLWNVYTNWRRAVVVYQEGFAYSDHKGIRTLRWDQIAGMTSAVTKHYTNGIYTGTTHTYTVWNKNGVRFVLNDKLPKVEELSNHIRQGTFPFLYKAAGESYEAGQRVQFGPVSISKTEGITVQKKSYKWEEVGQVKVEQGYLKVEKKGGGWFSGASTAIASIPNYEVLLSIINQVVGVRAG